MDELNIVNSLHTATQRDYLGRVNSVDKAWAAEKASKWGYDYWDGSRQTGYGGYKYDGRWKKVAKQLVEKYQLGDGAKILDVGCGKGFLLHDLKSQNPKIEVTGIDVSDYAIENALETIKSNCHLGCASELPFADDTFDLGSGFCIGHSFFCPTNSKDLGEEWYEEIINNQIVPLIEEYYFDKPEIIEEIKTDLLS